MSIERGQNQFISNSASVNFYVGAASGAASVSIKSAFARLALPPPPPPKRSCGRSAAAARSRRPFGFFFSFIPSLLREACFRFIDPELLNLATTIAINVMTTKSGPKVTGCAARSRTPPAGSIEVRKCRQKTQYRIGEGLYFQFIGREVWLWRESAL